MHSLHDQRLGRGDSVFTAASGTDTRSGAGADSEAATWESGGDSAPLLSSASKRSLRSVKSLIFDSHAHATVHGTLTSNSNPNSIPRIPRLSKNYLKSKSSFPRRSSADSPSSLSGLSRSMKKSTESDRLGFVSIRPRVSGVFTPCSLPPELWLLILRYATCPPFVALPGTPLSSYKTPFPSSSFSATGNSPSDPVSFLTHTPPHTHLAERLAEYNAHLQWKASLTRVCRVWNWVAQEILYEFVWIARGREGRALAGRLCGDVVGVGGGGEVCVSAGKKMKGKESGKGLGWFKKKDAHPHPHISQSSPVASTSCGSRPPLSRRPSFGDDSSSPSNVGRFIKRLHIETPSMDKCSPHDLLIILQYAPLLEVFEDYRSVRRPMHPLVWGASDVVPFSCGGSGSSACAHHTPQHRHGQEDLLAPDALLHTLLSRPLKKLSWTNYDYDPSDFELGVRFYEDVVGPRLMGVGVASPGGGGGSDKLEFLEISLSGGGVGMGGGGRQGGGSSTAWGIHGNSATVDEEDVRRRARMRVSNRRVGGSRAAAWVDNPQAGGAGGAGPAMALSLAGPLSGIGSANLLTELRADYTTTTTTTTTTYTSSTSFPQPSSPLDPSSSILDPPTTTTTSPPLLLLPNLRSLKATLDNATFFVLSTWDMPLLSHLSVMSADFGYAGAGFRRFFEVHGGKIIQLELGHSSGEVEEAWVTQPPPQAQAQVQAQVGGVNAHHHHPPGGNNTTSPTDHPFSVPLNEWCPNLKEFICSADAEWNWQSPDWIAPHVLLPTHPGLQFIGVRDMERRLVGDADDAARRRRENQGLNHTQGQGHAQGQAQVQGWDEDPYFMLLEQFGSLLRKEAFPSLLFVRDMSWESHLIRRTGRMAMASSAAVSHGSAGSVPQVESIPRWLPMPMSPYVAPLHSGSGFWSGFGSGSVGSSGPSSSSSSSSSLSRFSGFSSSSARKLISKASPLSSPFSSSSSASSSSSFQGASSSSPSSSSSFASQQAQAQEDALAHAQGLKVLRFWERVLERCRERGVWLEDWRGVNVTLGDLRRAACSS